MIKKKPFFLIILEYTQTIFFIYFGIGNGSRTDPGNDHGGTDSRQGCILDSLPGCHSRYCWSRNQVCMISWRPTPFTVRYTLQ